MYALANLTGGLILFFRNATKHEILLGGSDTTGDSMRGGCVPGDEEATAAAVGVILDSLDDMNCLMEFKSSSPITPSKEPSTATASALKSVVYV